MRKINKQQEDKLHLVEAEDTELEQRDNMLAEHIRELNLVHDCITYPQI